jgi:hypothetical protein
MNVEQSAECLAGETEVLRENLPQCCGRRPTTNFLGYGRALKAALLILETNGKYQDRLCGPVVRVLNRTSEH